MNHTDQKHNELPDGGIALQRDASPLALLIVVHVIWAGWSTATAISFFRTEGWSEQIALTPMVIVSLLLTGFCIHQWMLFLSPYPELTISSGTIVPGSQLSLHWQMSRPVKFRSLRIEAKAQERATFSQGTSSITDRHDIWQQTLVAIDHADGSVPRGTASLTIPPQAMHSFQSDHNQIVWLFCVHVEIPWWPNISGEFSFSVASSGGD